MRPETYIGLVASGTFTLIVGVALLAFIATFNISMAEQPTIGGTVVPVVHCAEDEVITWLGPDTLGCVHYENVR